MTSAVSVGGTLGSLGHDLSISISFLISTELLEAASEAKLSQDELIGVVLAIAVVLGSIGPACASLCAGAKLLAGRRGSADALLRENKKAGGAAAAGGAAESVAKAANEKTPSGVPPSTTAAAPAEQACLARFIELLLSIATRIAVAVHVQLQANSARQTQQLRVVRCLSLLRVAVFFLFLEAGGSVARR